MKFCNNVRLPEAQFCDICQKKKERGKKIPLYQDTLSFVCSSCYSAYFKKIEKAEIGGLVRIRPARVRPERYMMRSMFASSLITDIIMWPVIGAAVKAVCRLFALAYSEVFQGAVPIFMQMAMGVYAFFTALGLLNTVRLFIGSLLCGVNTARKVILLVKIVEYAVIAAAVVSGII